LAGPELELVRARRSVAFFETKADRLYQLYKEERILADVWRSRAAAAEDKLNQLDRQLAVEEVMVQQRERAACWRGGDASSTVAPFRLVQVRFL